MKNKRLLTTILLSVSLLLTQSVTAFAITEADVEAVGKETAAGNILIWFLCAVAFLKISQKIDSFMSSLGINVGHTGGSMLAEFMVAAKGLSSVKNVSKGGNFHGGAIHAGGSNSFSNASLFSGGLAGAVGRQFTQSAVQTVTGQKSNPISSKVFESSVQKGGDFANNVTSAVAQGSINYTGTMQGSQAASALTSYMGQAGVADAPVFSSVEIGGGRIMGTETSAQYPNGTEFGMYHAEQYMPPDGNYETIQTADQATWYRQYAADTVERTPYMTGEGKIAYHENIVQKLPNPPKRKDRV
ncbi:hypothetical protein [Eisenbergiella sp.]